MESSNVSRAKTLALAIAIAVGGPATAVRADELQDLKAQIEALQKKVGELEMKQETAEKKQAASVPDNVVTGGATGSGPATTYSVQGDPQNSQTGQRHFYSDQSGVIRYNVSAQASAGDSPLQ